MSKYPIFLTENPTSFFTYTAGIFTEFTYLVFLQKKPYVYAGRRCRAAGKIFIKLNFKTKFYLQKYETEFSFLNLLFYNPRVISRVMDTPAAMMQFHKQ